MHYYNHFLGIGAAGATLVRLNTLTVHVLPWPAILFVAPDPLDPWRRDSNDHTEGFAHCFTSLFKICDQSILTGRVSSMLNL